MTENKKYTCRECGKEIPDKRPYCSECRHKKELGRRLSEKRIEDKKTYFNRLYTLAAVIVAVAAISISAVILTAGKKEKPAGFGSLTVTSNPSGAKVVSLDESFPTGTTPITVKSLPAGKICKFSIYMAGCGKTNEITGVQIEADKEAKYHAELEKQGTLTVKSLPEDAEIYIDSVNTGKKTPSELENICEGRRKIELVFSDGTSTSAEAEVKWKEASEIYILKDDTKSGVKFDVPEGVKIFADGKYIGKAPMPIELFTPGKHRISAVSPKHLPYKGEFSAEKGKIVKCSPVLKKYGILEITASRRAYLYKGNEFIGALPIKVNCTPTVKYVADVLSEDGASWKQGFILKEGEYRRVQATLPPPPVYVPQTPVYTPPFTDFSGFRLESRFPPSEWLKTEDFMEDMDLDGESERILGFKNLQKKGEHGCKVYAFMIKKHDGVFFDVIPLKNPRLGCLGDGEIITLEALRSSDKYGYREIIYSTGTPDDGILEKGSFAIYKGQAYMPSWSKR